MGFNWVHGSFEMFDAIGADRICTTIEGEGFSLPAMLQGLRQAGAGRFYRNGEDQYLGLDGGWHNVPAE